ncbi:MAG: hypothetical protein J7M40_07700 [Planctomycetes bacterium]|nr:hypothetical protein [Planctomycetota bacterium]
MKVPKNNRHKLLATALMCIVICPSTAFCADRLSQKKLAHRFLKAGWKSGSVAIIDEAGMVRLAPDKTKAWEYYVPKGRDNHSCQPLPHGGFLVGETAPDGSWMVELDKDGNVIKKIKVADSNKDYHHAFRQVRKTPRGTYLGTIMSENKAYEWDKTGRLIRTFPNGLFVAIRLPNGNTLVSARPNKENEYAYVVEYDAEGKVAWSLTGKDIDSLGIRMFMVCGLHRLPNGNTVITNVNHGKPHGTGITSKLFEITRDKQLAWTHCDTTNYNMGNVQILDIKADASMGQVLK